MTGCVTLRSSGEALAAITEDRRPLKEQAAVDLAGELQADFDFFAGLLRRDPARADQARAEIELRQKLLESVRHEAVHLDSLALVVGS